MSDRYSEEDYYQEVENDYYDEPDDYWDDEEEDFDEVYGICSPSRCGECWGGDGICMQEIEAQAALSEEFNKFYVKSNIACPHCGKELTLFRIPTTELWIWPGEWPGSAYYPPYIALDIFKVFDTPKGEVHEPFEVAGFLFRHIWAGEGVFREEHLVMLDKGEENVEP